MRCLNRSVKIFSAMIAIFVFAGCASKEPQIVTKIEYQDVLVPIRCINKMPNKPKYDYEDIQTARDLMEYYKTCEEILKSCASQEGEPGKE